MVTAMTKADFLEAWRSYLVEARRRSPHTVRAYLATAARLLDAVELADWHGVARRFRPARRGRARKR